MRRKLTQSQPGLVESLLLSCPAPHMVGILEVSPHMYGLLPFSNLWIFCRCISILMVLLPQRAHSNLPLYTRLSNACRSCFLFGNGEASGWHSLMCRFRLTTSASQLPIVHVLFGLSCKIHNKIIAT